MTGAGHSSDVTTVHRREMMEIYEGDNRDGENNNILETV